MFCSFGIGYAAFQTNVSIKVKGNTKTMYASDTMKKLLRSNSLSMFTDPFGNIRYTGSNDIVNNYVCLVDESPCQDKHLYRIIGSFLNIDNGNGNLETRVKVVMANIYGNNYWDRQEDGHGSNNWARPASLNTLINGTYYAELNEEAQYLIGNSVWHLGGYNGNATAIQAYQYENGTSVFCSNYNDATTCNSSTWLGKIALIHSSDYAYASKDCYQNTGISSYYNDSCKNSNWMYSGYSEWLLTTRSASRSYVFAIASAGDVVISLYSYVNYSCKIRPSFYLKANTLLITDGHDGSSSNPYIAISID